MKKQYRLATFALSACLLMACGARETNAPENNEAEKQTENISNIDTKIDEAETSGALTESESRETPIAPKEILIDFTGISEFHPEGTAVQPYSLEILSETYNNITFADEWYNASEDISLPMIGENWDCCEFPYKSRVMGTSEPLKPLKAPYMARNPVKWGFFRLKGQEIPLKI